MAEEQQQIDAQQLAAVLVQARMRIDDIVAHLEFPSNRPLRVKPSVEDNNSTCNTACTCGAIGERVSQPGG